MIKSAIKTEMDIKPEVNIETENDVKIESDIDCAFFTSYSGSLQAENSSNTPSVSDDQEFTVIIAVNSWS